MVTTGSGTAFKSTNLDLMLAILAAIGLPLLCGKLYLWFRAILRQVEFMDDNTANVGINGGDIEIVGKYRNGTTGIVAYTRQGFQQFWSGGYHAAELIHDYLCTGLQPLASRVVTKTTPE